MTELVISGQGQPMGKRRTSQTNLFDGSEAAGDKENVLGRKKGQKKAPTLHGVPRIESVRSLG